MRCISFFSGENIIEVHNNMWTGKETIYYNDDVVSSGFSILGKTHEFAVEEDGELVDYKVVLELRWFGIGFSIFRNDIPLLLSF